MVLAMNLEVFFWVRLVVIVLILSLYFFVVRLLGFEEGDTKVLMPWRRKQRCG